MIENSVLPFPDDSFEGTQGTALHFGVVKSVDDPEMRGRVLVECAEVYGDEKPEYWTTWAEWFGNPVGSSEKKGDFGMWWPPVPGLLVALGFEGGNYDRPYCFPASAWGDDGKPYIPIEAKSQKKKSVNVRVLKSVSGATLMFDDNGKQEATFICDWTGAGFFSMAPGKKEDAKSSGECTASRMGQGEMRGDKSAFRGNNKKPSKLVEGGLAIIGTLDLNGQGLLQLAKDGNGVLIIFASPEKGEVGPSILLDSKSKKIFLTAGETQLVVNGEKGQIEVTQQIIQEQELVPMEGPIKGIRSQINEYFKKYKDEDE